MGHAFYQILYVTIIIMVGHDIVLVLFTLLLLQVFQYDGSLSCTGIEFGLFVLVGLVLVVFFVAPSPIAVGYICRMRPQVELSQS